MFGGLLYLRLTSFSNWLRVRVRRLRQPKYLLGAIVGFAYFYLVFFRNLGGPSSRGMRRAVAAQALDAAGVGLPSDWLPVAAALGSILLLAFIALMWAVPTERAALGFSEAEITFLFPAPLTRRA